MKWTIKYVAESEAARISVADENGVASIDLPMADAVEIADRIISQAWYLDANPADRLDRLRDELRTLNAHIQTTYNGDDLTFEIVDVLVDMEALLDSMIIKLDANMASWGLGE